MSRKIIFEVELELYRETQNPELTDADFLLDFHNFMKTINYGRWISLYDENKTVVRMVDAEKWERLRKVAAGAKEWFDAEGEESNDKMHAEDALSWLVDELQPGDLDTPS